MAPDMSLVNAKFMFYSVNQFLDEKPIVGASGPSTRRAHIYLIASVIAGALSAWVASGVSKVHIFVRQPSLPSLDPDIFRQAQWLDCNKVIEIAHCVPSGPRPGTVLPMEIKQNLTRGVDVIVQWKLYLVSSIKIKVGVLDFDSQNMAHP